MSETKTLCIFGSRDLTNRVQVFYEIEEGLAELGLFWGDVDLVLEGGALGIDRLAREYAIEAGIPYRTREAAWKDLSVPGAVPRKNKYGVYNAVAGHQRNQVMAEEGSHFIGVRKASGKSTGTDDMKSRIVKLGKPLAFRLL